MRGLGPAWSRPAALVFTLLAVASSAPYLHATLSPPPGTRFVGAFYSIPDVYNYFSYMQQAQDGFFLFTDKLSLAPHGARLVNVEWWAVGWFSGITGLGLPLSFRLLGVVSSLFLVLGVARWLARSGLPASHDQGALLLVFLGGGAGGILFLLLGPPAWRFTDLTSGLFPIISMLVNPHFVTGTALLVWSVLGLSHGGLGTLSGLVAGNVLGLSRPYDLVLLVGIRLLSVVATLPPSRWARALLPLAGLLPSIAVDYWVFFESSAFRGFRQSSPDLGAFALAIGPALLLAIPGAFRIVREESPARLYGMALLAWAVVVLLANAVLTIPFPFMSQSAVNVGIPLFGLAALGLARRSPRVLLLAAALYSSTGLIAMKLLLETNPSWFAPEERIDVAWALRPQCRPGEIVMAPSEIGMYANAYSSCRAFITHVVAPDSATRQEEMTAFYLGAGGDEQRALLDRRCVSHVVMPDAGEGQVRALLDPGSGFRRSAQVGEGPSALAIYSRSLPPSCEALRRGP
jgi:hypothetical protein